MNITVPPSSFCGCCQEPKEIQACQSRRWTGTNTWVRICLNSVGRIQFFFGPIVQVFWILPRLDLGFTFAFKIVSEVLDLGLPLMCHWIKNFTEGESWSLLLHWLSAGLLSQVLYSKHGLIFTKTLARIRVNKASCYLGDLTIISTYVQRKLTGEILLALSPSHKITHHSTCAHVYVCSRSSWA